MKYLYPLLVLGLPFLLLPYLVPAGVLGVNQSRRAIDDVRKFGIRQVDQEREHEHQVHEIGDVPVRLQAQKMKAGIKIVNELIRASFTWARNGSATVKKASS